MGRVTHNIIQVYNDQDYRETIAAKEIADTVGPLLATTYPGYRWRVEPYPHPTKPFVRVRLESANARYGFTVRLWEFYSASSVRAEILREGGEALERFKLNRRAFDEAELRAAKRNAAGVLIPEL